MKVLDESQIMYNVSMHVLFLDISVFTALSVLNYKCCLFQYINFGMQRVIRQLGDVFSSKAIRPNVISLRACLDSKLFWIWKFQHFRLYLANIVQSCPSQAQKIRLTNYRIQINYAISYFFYLYLMLYASAVRFDVTINLINSFEILNASKHGLVHQPQLRK